MCEWRQRRARFAAPPLVSIVIVTLAGMSCTANCYVTVQKLIIPTQQVATYSRGTTTAAACGPIYLWHGMQLQMGLLLHQQRERNRGAFLHHLTVPSAGASHIAMPATDKSRLSEVVRFRSRTP